MYMQYPQEMDLHNPEDRLHTDGLLEDLTRAILSARRAALTAENEAFREAVRNFLDFTNGIMARFPTHEALVRSHASMVQAIMGGQLI